MTRSAKGMRDPTNLRLMYTIKGEKVTTKGKNESPSTRKQNAYILKVVAGMPIFYNLISFICQEPNRFLDLSHEDLTINLSITEISTEECILDFNLVVSIILLS